MQTLLHEKDSVWAIGLMSGTSLDGVDAALIKTDGEGVQAYGEWLTLPYDDGMRAHIRAALNGQGDTAALTHDLTLKHAEAVFQLLNKAGISKYEIKVIGFHGQTLWHKPEVRQTLQIGDGKLLAETCGINVVNDFRSNDMAHGGQGAPLVPLYHAAIAKDMYKPLAILNIGGVANVTYLGAEGQIIAFDTGPGNALMDDWMQRHTDKPYDDGGRIAQSANVDLDRVSKFVKQEYFKKAPPKSLDRNTFKLEDICGGLKFESGLATLAFCTAEAVGESVQHFPRPALKWLVTGGGRHNRNLLRLLKYVLRYDVKNIDEEGLNGDALEAQAFAFLAVRSLKGLPLSLPTTTGVSHAVTGGVFYPAYSAASS